MRDEEETSSRRQEPANEQALGERDPNRTEMAQNRMVSTSTQPPTPPDEGRYMQAFHSNDPQLMEAVLRNNSNAPTAPPLQDVPDPGETND